MEKLSMPILLSNLVARTATIEDFHAIAELVAACDIAEQGIVDSSTRGLVCLWQHHSFQLKSDAWVIVSARKQLVGFACVWHRDHEEFYTFICVHPQYQKRGIGTRLMRVAEQHTRELMHYASPGTRVSLRGVVSANNAQARSLFEREGYLPIREFWRVTLELVESSEGNTNHVGKFAIDLDAESGQLVGTKPLYNREGIYIVQQFVTYEKELRSVGESQACSDKSSETLIRV
jgi:ribosomal protein S18 acetylase RimI-like enzyme